MNGLCNRYASKPSAVNAIESIRKNGLCAPTEDNS
ncbi:DUF1508 domain-containing protein [Blastomonas sp.]